MLSKETLSSIALQLQLFEKINQTATRNFLRGPRCFSPLIDEPEFHPEEKKINSNASRGLVVHYDSLQRETQVFERLIHQR